MCGICGFVGPPHPQALVQMREALRHRGPDDAGAYADAEVSLGHRRLAIVDVAGGKQPTFNEQRSVIVVFNGEIYNHPQLRPVLEKLGHQYESNADTESIVHAYETYGTDAVRHLDGMFAFVLYDKSRRLLFGARDRLGKKPLYYTTAALGEGAEQISFAFASELKSLRGHPLVARQLELSRAGLVSYLLNDYLSASATIYGRIRTLEPGCAFVYGLPGSEHEGFRHWRYWDIDLASGRHQPGTKAPSDIEAGDRVRELLQAAVERRLMADVPLGAFLSGGIDSSTVVAMLTRLRPAAQVKTFSIGFRESSFDESAYSQEVARHFGTEHHTRQFTAQELLDELPRVTDMLDEPLADPSVLPVSLLCAFARQWVTVAIGGDGGDELFAGYDPFRAVTPGNLYYRWVPRLIHRGIALPMARLLPASDANMALEFRVARFLRGAATEPGRRLATWMGPFSLEQLQRLLPDFGELLDPERAYGPVLAAQRKLCAAGCDGLQQALDFFERFYLPDDILVKVDRASMMHSLEVRSPFLDTALVEYVNALPNRMKLRRLTTKHLLKRMVVEGKGWDPILPRRIAHRGKKGFGIPVARWIRHDLRDTFRELLVDDWPEQLDMFNRAEIEQLHARHLDGAQNNYKELWALFMLAQWTRKHLR